MQKKKKHAGGRPKERVRDKVDFEYVDKLLGAGLTKAQLAVALDVQERTITNWQKDPEFLSHLKNAKCIADDRVERSLFERATGYNYPAVKIFCNSQGEVTMQEYTEHVPPDPTSMIFWLKNRRPAEWKDRREVSTTININRVDFSKLTPDELARIATHPETILSTTN